VRPVWLLPTGRSTFVQEAGNATLRGALDELSGLGATIHGPDRLVEFAGEVPEDFAPAADGISILLCATFADASVAEAAFGRAPGPVLLWSVRDPAPTGERLYQNSLCGANLAAHALVRRGVGVRLLHGDPGEPGVREALAGLLRDGLDPAPPAPRGPRGPMAGRARVVRALDGLRGSVVGLVGETPLGFTTCEFDGDWLDSELGVEVHRLSLEDVFDRIRRVPVAEREGAVAAMVSVMPSTADLPVEQVELCAATERALGAWVREEAAEAVALRCWPEFPLELGVCPCSALGRLAERGTATACEGDVLGAVTMLLAGYLGARHNYLADVVRIDREANAATFWHCGLAPRTLAPEGQEATQDLHCNRGIGVAGNFPLRPGPVTILRLGLSAGRHRLFLTRGEALPGPNRFKGNSVDVRLCGDAEATVRTLIEEGFEHHTVLAWADVAPEVRTLAAVLGLELIEIDDQGGQR
jgi:L-fucose isomerase-like protein